MRIVIGLFYLLHFLPRVFLKPIAYALGELTYWLSAERRRVGRFNLARAFPDKTAAERDALLRQHFRLFMLAVFDRVYLWFSGSARLRRLVRVEGREHIERTDGERVLLFAPHFNGLDAGAIRLMLDYRIAGLYAHLKNPVMDRFVLKKRTRFLESRVISRLDGIRPLVSAFKDGFQLYHLPDLDYGRDGAAFVDWFGHPAATTTSLPRIARLTRTKVVPALTLMEKGGYVLKLFPAWEGYPTGDWDADTRYMNAWLENAVRQYPAQYFWLHKRYKTRLPGEPNPYDKR